MREISQDLKTFLEQNVSTKIGTKAQSDSHTSWTPYGRAFMASALRRQSRRLLRLLTQVITTQGKMLTRTTTTRTRTLGIFRRERLAVERLLTLLTMYESAYAQRSKLAQSHSRPSTKPKAKNGSRSASSAQRKECSRTRTE